MAGDSHREVACVAPGFSPAFPSLWHSHSWLCSLLCGPATLGCAPLSAPGVHRDRVLAAPSPTRHLPSRMVLRDESVGLRRETASFPRFMRRNLSSLRALRPSSSRLRHEAQETHHEGGNTQSKDFSGLRVGLLFIVQPGLE